MRAVEKRCREIGRLAERMRRGALDVLDGGGADEVGELSRMAVRLYIEACALRCVHQGGHPDEWTAFESGGIETGGGRDDPGAGGEGNGSFNV